MRETSEVKCDKTSVVVCTEYGLCRATVLNWHLPLSVWENLSLPLINTFNRRVVVDPSNFLGGRWEEVYRVINPSYTSLM